MSLLEHYGNPAWIYLAVSVGLSREEAEDVIQSTFIKLLHTEHPSPKGLLITAIRNAAIDYKRNLWERAGAKVSFDYEPVPGAALHDIIRADDPCPDTAMIVAETMALLERRMGKCALKMLLRTDLITYKENARMMGKPINTAKTHISRARATAQEILEHEQRKRAFQLSARDRASA